MTYILFGLRMLFLVCVIVLRVKLERAYMEIEMLQQRNDTLAGTIQKQDDKLKRESGRPSYAEQRVPSGWL